MYEPRLEVLWPDGAPLAAGDEDSGVPPENSIAYYLALRKEKVPAELHIYQNGAHGVGLAPDDKVLASWPTRLRDWLEVRGIISTVA